MFSKANVGLVDRVIRIVVGFALIFVPLLSEASLFANPALYWGLPIVGLVLLLTGLVRFCPAYRLIGIDTCRTGAGTGAA